MEREINRYVNEYNRLSDDWGAWLTDKDSSASSFYHQYGYDAWKDLYKFLIGVGQ